jgi:hypothetical protein
MTTYRELLERALALLGKPDHVEESERLYSEIDAYLAQPITTGLTEEEQKQARWHRQDEEHPELCHSNCGEGWPCFIASTLRSLAEPRAREGELVAALEECEAALRKDGERILLVRNAGLRLPEPLVGTLPRSLKIANRARAALAQGKKE